MKEKFRFHQLILRKNEIINRRAILPAMVCGLSYLGYGAILTIVPDQCDFLQIHNKGLFFTSYTLSTVLSRLVAGQISDRLGRLPVMRLAIVLLTFSYIYFAFVQSPTGILIASGLVGFSIGIVIPAVFAWTVDRSEDHNRGKSFATMYIGLEFSIGLGAILSAWIYQSNPNNFSNTFLIIAAATLLALAFVRDHRPSSQVV